jgi:hypothetical protein
MIRVVVSLVMAGLFLVCGHACVFADSLFWTVQGDSHIYRSHLDGTNPTTFLTSPVGTPTGLAVDPVNSYLYWASTSLSGGCILRTKLGTVQPPETVASTSYGGLGGLALDIGGGYVYWTVPNDGVIQRATLAGGTVTSILSGLGSPMDLAVDYDQHKLAWTELTAGKIGRSNLDGSGAETKFSGLSSPTGTAFDYIGHSLFWAETDKICHGPSGANILTGLGNVFDLDINQRDHQVYWSSPTGASEGIHRANLDGSSLSLLIDVPAGYIAVGIPEPSGIVLAGTGLIGVLAYASRHRMKNG